MVTEPRRLLRSPALPTAFCAVVAERRLLKRLAGRLLGSAGAAEHAVRETYVRWYTMPDDEKDGIDTPVAWLVGTLVRICVDLLETGRTEAAFREWYAWHDAPGCRPAGRRIGLRCSTDSGDCCMI